MKTISFNFLSFIFLFSGFFFTVLFGLSTTINGQDTIYYQNFGSETDFPLGWVPSGSNTWTISIIDPSSTPDFSGESNLSSGSSTLPKTVTFSDNLSTVGYSNITLLWGAKRTYSNLVTCEWSLDSIIWTAAIFTDVNIGTWQWVNGNTRIDLPPETAGASNVSFRWTYDSDGTEGRYRIDDFSVEGCLLPDTAGIIAGPASVCQGQSEVQYFVPVINNATSYTWEYDGEGATINNETNDTITISFSNSATSGNLTVNGYNDCGNGAQSSKSITVDPLPGTAGTITGLSTVCQGQIEVQYFVPVINNATSYKWEYDGEGATINNETNDTISISFSNSATSGNLTVNGYNDCGDGVQSSKSITVDLQPGTAGSITGLANVCQGQSEIQYFVPVINNATSYIWAYDGDGATISNETNDTINISFSNSATSGNLTVNGHNDCGDGVQSSKSITVDLLPGPAGLITGFSQVCQGQSDVQYSIPLISNAVSYSWNYSGEGAIIDIASNIIMISFLNSATSGTLTVKGHNNCGDGAQASKSITVNQLPGSAGNIIGPSSVCNGQSNIQYSVLFIPNAISYIWDYSGEGATISGTSNAVLVSFSNSATSGTLTVKGYNNCGYGIPSVKSIDVNQAPGPAGTITGYDTICQGESDIQYTIPEIFNAVSYSWHYSGNGATINGLNNSIMLTFSNSATSGTLSVNGQNDCGDGISSNKSIHINPLPDTSAIVAKPQTGTPYVLLYPGDTTGIEHTYQWYKNGELLNGATLKFYYDADGIDPGTLYKVIVMNEFNCAIELEYSYNKNKNGLFKESDIFTIYPNPSNGEFNIILNEAIILVGKGSITCRIKDVNGKLKYKTELPCVDQTISLQRLNKGVYLIELIIDGNYRQIRKLLIQ